MKQTPLQEYVELLRKIIRKSRQVFSSKRKSGRPQKYSDIEMLIAFVVMQLKRIESLICFHEVLKKRKDLREMIGWKKVPHYTTFYRRYRKLSEKVEELQKEVAKQACERGICEQKIVVGDSQILQARGPVWHKSYKERGEIPQGLRGIDQEAEWGFSNYKKWVYGYKVHQLVFIGNKGVIFPFRATVTKANVHDGEHFKKNWVGEIPEETEFILLDGIFDDMELRTKTEKKRSDGKVQKRMIAPFRGKIKESRREEYAKWYAKKEVKKIYCKRKETIERLHAHQREVFGWQSLPLSGYERVKTWVSINILLFQISILINHSNNSHLTSIKSLLRAA